MSAEADSPDVAPRAGRQGGGTRNARRRAREFALQGIYQWLLSGEDGGAIEAHIATTPGFARADGEHFRSLLHGCLAGSVELHEAIAPHLDRPVKELSPVEHAVLLLGCYELARHPEIPMRVVINEAVEISKSYGGTDGFKYVNGVLDRVAARLRAPELGRG